VADRTRLPAGVDGARAEQRLGETILRRVSQRQREIGRLRHLEARFAAPGAHSQLAEKAIRKLRAGMMPPPGPSAGRRRVEWFRGFARRRHRPRRRPKKLRFRGLAQDPTWVDPSGSTAFWRAAQSADTAAMKLLAAHGADPKIANNQGDTPLIVASGVGWMANHSHNLPGGWLAAIEYCVELGADVNAVDSRGYTALHGAAYIGDNDAVRFLVSKGAKIDAKSRAGDTVADMANGPTRVGLPHPETVALLESLGSANSHNCRSDQCLVAPKEDRKPANPARAATQPAPTQPATTQPAAAPPKGGK
jgi:hypothetical protein